MPELNASRVLAAWTDPERVPEYHFAMQAKLRREWPALASALDGLAMQQMRGGCGAVNPRNGWICEWDADGKHHTHDGRGDWYDWSLEEPD